MRRFYAKNIILSIIIILLFTGCKNNDGNDEVIITNAPIITEQPFFLSTEVLSGGDGLSNLNLADIKIEKLENNNVAMTLSFMTGSSVSLTEQQISSGVPDYSISHIQGVDRMVIKLDGISGWTYRVYEDEIQDNGIIQGILKQEPIGNDSLYLYVSAKNEYVYRVETLNNKIQIIISPIEESITYDYYIKINAFLDYESGFFSNEDFYPCISNDGTNGVLLSGPFKTLEEANDFYDSNINKISESIDTGEVSIIYLGSNELPEYNYQNELEKIINKPIGYSFDEPVTGKPLITEGRFLSWSNNQDEYVYAKSYNLQGSQESDDYIYEEIWVRSNDGDVKLVDHRCTSILSAKYSYENRFIAFIDQNDETRMLEIVDTETGNVYIPADDGFGIDTSSFVWSNSDNRLYAITGQYDSKQLLCYDMRDLKNINVFALTEEEYMESSLYMHDSYIYYLKSGDDAPATEIYFADIENSREYKLISGNSFMLSSNGKNIIVNDMLYDDVNQYSFFVYSTGTKEINIIESGRMIMDYTFARNDTRVYYTVYKNAGWEDEYPLELYYYDINKKKSFYVMDMITGALYPAYEDEQVLIMSIFQLQDSQITITYNVEQN